MDRAQGRVHQRSELPQHPRRRDVAPRDLRLDDDRHARSARATAPARPARAATTSGGHRPGCLSSLGVGGTLEAGGGAASPTTRSCCRARRCRAARRCTSRARRDGGGAGAAFGDGLRCAGGRRAPRHADERRRARRSTRRGAQRLVRVKGGVTAPGVRTYQVWYRNAAAFCTASTFNLTNGWELTWTP